MNENTIPYIAHESAMTRMERVIKRLWILCIVLIVLLVGTNIAWLYYESQFEDTTMTITQEVEADDNGRAIINDGVHINGNTE